MTDGLKKLEPVLNPKKLKAELNKVTEALETAKLDLKVERCSVKRLEDQVQELYGQVDQIQASRKQAEEDRDKGNEKIQQLRNEILALRLQRDERSLPWNEGEAQEALYWLDNPHKPAREMRVRFNRKEGVFEVRVGLVLSDGQVMFYTGTDRNFVTAISRAFSLYKVAVL